MTMLRRSTSLLDFHEMKEIIDFDDMMQNLASDGNGWSDDEDMKQPQDLDEKPSLPLQSLRRASSFCCLYDTKTVEGKRIRFSDVSVRVYDLTLGDNPCVTHGPPTSLGWDYVEMEKSNIFSFENEKFRRPRRDTLRLSINTRETLLMDAGFTRTELNEAVKSVKKTKKNRLISDAFAPLIDAHASLKSALKKMMPKHRRAKVHNTVKRIFS